MAGKPKHGLSRTPEYRAWQTMRLRCNNPDNAAYPAYGGRGIKVCDRWADDVSAFVADMGLRPSPDHQIDRKDNDGDYEPGNCRWATRSTNCRNRRTNRLITFRGEQRTLSDWCERLGLPKDTVAKRLNMGWTVDAALVTPVRSKAENGKAPDPRGSCVDCGRPEVWGIRCKSCENTNRGNNRKASAANFAHEKQRQVAS